MKAVVLAGGRGTRISEESHLRPKPMIAIGGRPILWHIMKAYAHHGVTDFIICLGAKGYMIKEYFSNYFLHGSDVTIDLQRNIVSYHDIRTEPWKITLVDTGETTQTGGRVKRIARYLEGDDSFCLTYGDILSSIDIGRQIAFHRARGKLATMAVVRPPARFGSSVISDDDVVAIDDKPDEGQGYVNGGFFVLSSKILDLISGDETRWEGEPLQRLAGLGQINAWRHEGFWQLVDTARDVEVLDALWATATADWKVWD